MKGERNGSSLLLSPNYDGQSQCYLLELVTQESGENGWTRGLAAKGSALASRTN